MDRTPLLRCGTHPRPAEPVEEQPARRWPPGQKGRQLSTTKGLLRPRPGHDPRPSTHSRVVRAVLACAIIAPGFLSSSPSTATPVATRVVTPSWHSSARALPNIGLNPGHLSCPSVTFCMAAAGSDYSRFDGSKWTAADTAGRYAIADVDSVSCVSSTFCVATEYGEPAIWNGSRWGRWSRVGRGPQLFNSCTSSRFCLGLDGQGGGVRFDGSRWTRRQLRHYLLSTGMSCASSSFCMAVGSDFQDHFLTQKHTSTGWHRVQSHGAWDASAVSCTRGHFCAAGSIGGKIIVYRNGTWNRGAQVFRSLRSVNDISCASSGFCVAVDVNNEYSIYNGQRWSAPSRVEPAHPHRGGIAVQCPLVNRCYALDSAGFVTEYS